MNHRYSFTDLFTQEVDFDKDTRVKVSSVIIPQIQRPYAQGRTDGVCTYIRNTFLDNIFDSFERKNEDIFDLNFIYGIIKPNNDEYKLELLDGQQRLTTLFLLYWYVINAEFELDQEESVAVRDCLSKFLYETRTTSTVFCQELASYKVSFKDSTPREVIRKAMWYFKSFDRDSTICAMLTMLDSIHERYLKLSQPNVFPKLQNIQFYVKSLGVYNLSEELYIKMNARGLQLSPFENFKADLTNYVSNKGFGKFEEKVALYGNDTFERVPFHFNFSVKLDAKWVDIFWKNGAEDFDDSYMSFFSRYFACKYIISSKDVVSDRDMRSDKTLKFFYTDAEEQLGSNEYFGFNAFESILNIHPEYIITLDKVLDILYQYDCKSSERCIYKNMIPSWDKKSENDGDDFYCNTLVSKMSQIKLVALSAFIEYVDAMETFDVSTFKNWMRVVWNVIENTNIDSLTPVSSLIRKFSAIIHFVSRRMAENETFYSSLSKWHQGNSSERENRAVLEEVEKARRISENKEWEEVWKDVESHPYFKGMATFFYNPEMTITEYSENMLMAKQMFNKNGISDSFKEDHILIRAIVSQYDQWDEINEQYITEKAEKNKYLKNILASNEKVRKMLADVMYGRTIPEVIATLKTKIEKANLPQLWSNADREEVQSFNMAIDRLRNDVKIYDWFSSEEEKYNACFRFYMYEGHFMLAIRSRQYARLALDTDRAKIAHRICEKYDFYFDDPNQKSMYENFGDCFGKYLYVKQVRKDCIVWVKFEHKHELNIQLECKTQSYIILPLFRTSC